VPVHGLYSGRLDNAGERLTLSHAFGPSVFSVAYDDEAPWPPAADGSGASLQRRNANGYGNDPANWEALEPTPGRSAEVVDTDGDGLPDAWELAHGTDRFMADADADPDSDGATNQEEYSAGTDPQSAQSRLTLDAIIASSGAVSFHFLALSNRSYSVLYKNSLEAPIWSKLTDVESHALDRIVEVQDPAAVLTNRFYRLATPGLP
jgi:hypothetical protein